MDLTIIILGVIFTLICTLPFILSANSRKNKSKFLFNNLQDLAKNASCNLTKYALNGNYAIGLDEQNKVCFFYKKVNEKISEEIIYLKEVKTVEWQKIDKFNTARTQSAIDKLQLKFAFNDSSKSAITLSFFDLSDGLGLSDEFASMKKWHQEISAII